MCVHVCVYVCACVCTCACMSASEKRATISSTNIDSNSQFLDT